MTHISWAPNDATLLSCGTDGAIYEWDLRDGKRRREFMVKSAKFTGVCYASAQVEVGGGGGPGGPSLTPFTPSPALSSLPWLSTSTSSGGGAAAGPAADPTSTSVRDGNNTVFAVGSLVRAEGRTQDIARELAGIAPELLGIARELLDIARELVVQKQGVSHKKILQQVTLRIVV